MFKVSMDKKLDLILGLEYSAARRHEHQYPGTLKNNEEYCENFYKLYENNRTLELDKFILSGGFGIGVSSIELALSLDDNYNITNPSPRLKDKINIELANKFIKDFVIRSNYESFVLRNKELTDNTCLKYKTSANKYIEFDPAMFEKFFGLSIGEMSVILLNFSKESYYFKNGNKAIAINSYLVNNTTKNIESNGLLISNLFYSFAHCYMNQLGEKFFNNVDISEFVSYSNKHGIEINNPVTLVNEYTAKAVEVILLEKFVSQKLAQQRIEEIYKEGYTFIYELVEQFNVKNMVFDVFYLNNIVTFFDDLNKKIKKANIKK